MNSMLNPEAPEFFPHMASITEEALLSLCNTVKSSNRFPSGVRYEYLKTFPEFDTVTHKFSENVTDYSNIIVQTELPLMSLSPKESPSNSTIFVDCTDRFLDRAEINMEALNNIEKEEDLDDSKPSTSTASLNKGQNNVVLTEVQVGSSTLLGANNILRPQLTFKDSVDNTSSLWVPKISDKPNNIKPLALNILYNDKGEAVGYEHPYKVELDLYKPPQEFVNPDPEPPRFPPPVKETKLTYIETESQVDQLVEHLSTVKELAIDLEHHAYRTYQGITCLIQISTDEGGDFIIDALAVREHLHKLNLSFTDPRKLKVLHGADMDIMWLQRDFGVYIVGLFDTYRAAKALFREGFSLKHMLLKYCNIHLDKKYQLADWRMRPLPGELLHYARMDTHYLLYVWRRMKADLINNSAGTDELLRSVFTRSKFVCGGTYKKPVVTQKSHMSTLGRVKHMLDSRQMAALKMLYKWRDAEARILDESTSYLIPNHMLLALAITLPREVQGLHACCNPMPPFIKLNILAIHKMLLSCRLLPLEPEVYIDPTAPGAKPYFRRRLLSHDVHDLSNFQDIIDDDGDDMFYVDPSDVDFEQKPQLEAILPDEEERSGFTSNLNVDAEMYIPPYYRYRGYRYLTKDEELRHIESTEAKVSAIAQGDPLIKAEVLDKLQMSKKLLDNTASEKSLQRKRKISTEKVESEIETNAQENKDATGADDNESRKAFNYDVDYKKFQDDGEEMGKQAKKKFTKHK